MPPVSPSALRSALGIAVLAGCALAACGSSKHAGSDGGPGIDDASADAPIHRDSGAVVDARSDSGPILQCTPPGPPPPGAPTLFMAPSPVAPNQAALLFGANVGAKAKVFGARLRDGNPGLPPGAADCVPSSATALDVVQGDALSAMAVIPSTWKAGVYALYVQNATGSSAPVILNRPRIDWVHGSSTGTIVAGSSFAVYGRSFGASPGGWLVDAGGKVTALDSPTSDAGTSSDGYEATFAVPALATGGYTLYLHSGLGGTLGFSNPLAVTVAAAAPWPTAVFHVAAGTGDDDAAFAAALAKAESHGGGVVAFATGSYTLTKGVTIPAETVVTSASGKRGDVTLIFSEPVTPFPYAFAGDGNFTVRSITVTSSTAARLFQCPTGPDFLRDPVNGEPQYQPDSPCENATIDDVSFTLSTLRDLDGTGTPTFTLLAAINGNDCTISHSTLTNTAGGAIAIAKATGLVLRNNTLVSGTTRVPASAHMPLSAAETALGGGCGLFGLHEAAIVGNTIGPTPALGSAATMYLEGDAHDLYVADNTIGPNLSNYGEGFSFDAPYYPSFIGTPSATSGRQVTLPKVFNAAGNTVFQGPLDGQWAASASTTGTTLAGQEVLVVNGTGIGQYAEVASNLATAADGSTELTVDRDWAIPLDATSVIAVVTIKSRVVFARNTFHDVAVGAQLYAGGYDFLIDGTRGDSLEGTYCNTNDFMSQRASKTDQQRRFAACFFDQWINTNMTNKVDPTWAWVDDAGSGVSLPYVNGLVGSHGYVGPDPLLPPQRGVQAVGNIVRANTVRSFTLGYYQSGGTGSDAGVNVGQSNLVEGNRTQTVPIGVIVGPSYPGTLVRDNTCVSGCTTTVVDQSDGG